MKNQALNQLINFFWTILCFVPVVYYWMDNYSAWLYVLILLSAVFAFLPNSIISELQLSRNKKFYERLGVKLIQKLVQTALMPTKPSIRMTRNIK